MPFKSQKQKTYLKINEPTVYNRWKKKYPVVKKKTGRQLSSKGRKR
tara:strand:- start:428 stop:565 length:138 start_codon:yes stop_codon:yes gene_type:complete